MRISLIIFSIFILFCLSHLLFRSQPTQQRALISHRGAGALAPENTLAGIEVAFQHQVTLIEVDVRRSQDGQLLLLHDRSVDRTTNGQGEVQTLPWQAIQALDAGRHFGAEFAGAPIPTFDDVLRFIQNKPITLVVELKDTALYPGIEQAVVAAIKQYRLEQQIRLISFQQSSLRLLSQIAPELQLGLLDLYPIKLAGYEAAIGNKARLISLYWPSVVLDPTLIHRLHQRGYVVWVWTVNNPQLIRLLFWLGVDGITTDRPNLALNIVGAQ